VVRSNYGPADGPALAGDLTSPIGVLHTPHTMPIGVAFTAGSIAWRHDRPVALWRLVIDKAELPGRYVLDSGWFVEVEAWLEAHGQGDVTA
jgi:hypothetical protein